MRLQYPISSVLRISTMSTKDLIGQRVLAEAKLRKKKRTEKMAVQNKSEEFIFQYILCLFALQFPRMTHDHVKR